MTAVALPEIEEDYFDQVWSADLDVLDALFRQGDRPEIHRIIDVSFRGKRDDLERLAAFSAQYGFRSRMSETEQGDPWLFLERSQCADVQSIKALTKLSLQLEVLFGVELDGWGCEAQTGVPH